MTLAAIVGGLLVARFVSIDSDQQTSRQVLTDARERLNAARERAAGAWKEILDQDADDFFSSAEVIDAVTRGLTAPHDLMRAADWYHSENDLRPYAEQVAAEYRSARDILPALVTEPDAEWDEFRRGATSLPQVRWPLVWEHVYQEIAVKLSTPEARRREADRRKADADRLIWRSAMDPAVTPLDSSALTFRLAQIPATRKASGRRIETLLTNHQVALQQVQDFEGELRRLQTAHAEIVRPDARLWWGVGIVLAFAMVGIALPLWIMAQGPKNLTSIGWLFWPFAVALAALLVYIVVYLAQLGRVRPPTDNRALPAVTRPGSRGNGAARDAAPSGFPAVTPVNRPPVGVFSGTAPPRDGETGALACHSHAGQRHEWG